MFQYSRGGVPRLHCAPLNSGEGCGGRLLQRAGREEGWGEDGGRGGGAWTLGACAALCKGARQQEGKGGQENGGHFSQRRGGKRRLKRRERRAK